MDVSSFKKSLLVRLEKSVRGTAIGMPGFQKIRDDAIK